eukprot:6185865-Pleurochrysis_carterae.AAC.3
MADRVSLKCSSWGVVGGEGGSGEGSQNEISSSCYPSHAAIVVFAPRERKAPALSALQSASTQEELKALH